MVIAPAVSSEAMRRYFDGLQAGADAAYAVARTARAKGIDPDLGVEIPQTQDLASRVETLLADYGVEGVAERIRTLSESHDREEVAILVSKEMAARPAPTPERAIDRAVRVGLAVLTEGILVAPLEGLAEVKVKRNADGSTYVDLFFAGPIRSAGGTGQALSVLIADVVRRELGVGRYQPTRPEVERFREEIPLYRQVQHLQYTPTDEEVDLIVSNCPVGINGEGTEEMEISGYRDLKRIETNRIRGGACLVIADGLCLKAPKIQKHVRRLGIDGWDFLDTYLHYKTARDDEGGNGVEPSDTFIQNIVAGRPVLCHASRPGGLRLRYGRSRATGLASLALHPATMYVLDDFVAVGTQIKIERPGKAGAVTPCDTLEGPVVELEDGSVREVTTREEALAVRDRIRRIVDLGEILIPYGEFLENNHVLVPGAFSPEWYAEEFRAAAGELPADWKTPTPEQAIEWSERYRVPLHPRYNLFFHDVSAGDLRLLRDFVLLHGVWENGGLVLERDPGVKEVLTKLGAVHEIQGGTIRLDRHSLPLVRCLGLAVEAASFSPRTDSDETDPMSLVAAWAGFPLKPRGPTRIGARMARPEKAAPRKMQPAPHALFPIGREGGSQRLLRTALAKNEIEVQVGIRACARCGKRWFLSECTCGGHTKPVRSQLLRATKIPLRHVVDRALARLGESKLPEVKAVQGMISRGKTPEALEKGLLRAKHEIFVCKDGTTRFDMTNLVLTHFRPSEAGLPLEKARDLGYERDMYGMPLTSSEQMLELAPQDVILPREAGAYLIRVSKFVDDLLEKVYGLPRFYNAEEAEDLIGHLAVTLAPHTSGGVLARIVGYTPARAWFGHPFLVAARRRNADGDEDSVILLLDCLLNFSRSFLPERRGGLMDAPLVLTTRIDPNEIDKEAHNLDVGSRYPLAFFRATETFAHPRELESSMDLVSRRIGSVLQFEGFGYTHETGDIAAAPTTSAYVEGSMEEKMEGQLRLALKIRAVDANDVVSRIIVHHFLPDLIGNLKAFSSQMVRCTKCNAKYRRIPLKARCVSCGGNLTLTVHESSVKKYLEMTKRITQEHDVSPYLRQRIVLIEDAITSLFTNERVSDLKLDDFL